MASKRRLVSEPQGDRAASFGKSIRLILRLVADGRVNPLLKLLPVASLVYLFSPLDAPIPLIDDALVLWLGNSLFLELCPPDVVDEHRTSLEPIMKPKDPDQSLGGEDIIDAQYKEK